MEWIVRAETLDDLENEGRFEIVGELVRCENCKYFHDMGKFFPSECRHPRWDRVQGFFTAEAYDEDYCIYGDRREAE